jgi:Acetyltransferase (GNAT) domain
MITVSEENGVDFETTARIATEAFGSKEVAFSPPRMKWLYERGFGQGSAVVAAFDDGRKVGQIVLLHQNIYLDGEPVIATQLVDLFILQAYRSPTLVRRLYREVERLCEAKNIRVVITLPNENSAPLNARFLKLRPFLSLPVRAGLSLGWPRRKTGRSKGCPASSRQLAKTACTGMRRRCSIASAIRHATMRFMRPKTCSWSPPPEGHGALVMHCCAASLRGKGPPSPQAISAP